MASRITLGEAGTWLIRTPMALEIALRIAGVMGTVATSETPLAPYGPMGSRAFDENEPVKGRL